MLFFNTTNNCCICLEENKSIFIKCKDCPEGKVCFNCINEDYHLNDKTIMTKCPICRRESSNYPNWFKFKNTISLFYYYYYFNSQNIFQFLGNANNNFLKMIMLILCSTFIGFIYGLIIGFDYSSTYILPYFGLLCIGLILILFSYCVCIILFAIIIGCIDIGSPG